MLLNRNSKSMCGFNSQFTLINTLILTLFLCGFQVNSKPVKPEHPLTGLWIEAKKHKVAVWVEECQEQLCGRIYWLKKPLSADGKPKLDAENPNVSLRSRPQCGLKILTGFSPTKNINVWRGGKIYYPKSGKTYKSNIQISKDGSLKIRGYVGISLFGKTLKWERPKEKLVPCNQNTVST